MSALRDKTTATVQFRRALEQITILLLTQASKDWPIITTEIETPLAATSGGSWRSRSCLCRFFGAGLGLLEAMLRVIPEDRRRPHWPGTAMKLPCGRSILL